MPQANLTKVVVFSFGASGRTRAFPGIAAADQQVR